MKSHAPRVQNQQSTVSVTATTAGDSRNLASTGKKVGIVVAVGIITIAAQAAASNLVSEPYISQPEQPSNSIVQGDEPAAMQQEAAATPAVDPGHSEGSQESSDQPSLSSNTNDVQVQVSTTTSSSSSSVPGGGSTSGSSSTVVINGQEVTVPKSGVVRKTVVTPDGTSKVKIKLDSSVEGEGTEVVNFISY